ncbi:MAG: acyl carrier protein [candidate division Zixibacteria bacterium]|nr:acyl carrier protein [candidate division Zixibacteria bacterium]
MTAPVSPDCIRGAIFAAIRIVNQLLPSSGRLAESEEQPLVGARGALDSLQFVNFVVAVEQQLTSDCGINLVLTDADVLANQEQIFATVGSLMRYVQAQTAGV